MMQGAYDQAIQQFEQAVKLDGTLAESYQNLCVLFYVQHSYEAAADAGMKALRLYEDGLQHDTFEKADRKKKIAHIASVLNKVYQQLIQKTIDNGNRVEETRYREELERLELHIP